MKHLQGNQIKVQRLTDKDGVIGQEVDAGVVPEDEAVLNMHHVGRVGLVLPQ